MRLALVLPLALLAAACASRQLRAPPPVTDPAQAADVTVIRPKAFIASDTPIYVTVRGDAISLIANGEYLRFRMPAGRDTLGVACLNDTNSAAFDFPAGQSLFFRITPSAKCGTIEQVDALTASKLMAGAIPRGMPALAAAATAGAAALSAPSSPGSCSFSFTIQEGRALDAGTLRRERPELYRLLERPAVRDVFLSQLQPTLSRLGVADPQQAYDACGGIIDDLAGRLSLVLSPAEAQEVASSLSTPAAEKFLGQLVAGMREQRLAPEIAARLASSR